MSRRFDVFVSHSSKDKPWVHRLVADLARYGVSVWLDENEIRPGDLFATALEQGIAQSRAVTLVVSPEAMDSGWVKEEYNHALTLAQRKGEQLQLIPVLLRTAELPGFLESRSWVDFRDDSQYAQSVWRLAWGITGEKPGAVMELDANAPPPLPSGYIPEPASLPLGSRMPMARNPLFVGREDELRELAEALQVGNTAAISQVASVTGLGGMGKTQLAAELVHRYGQFFPGGVFWLSFADPASVPSEIALCGGPGHLGLWSEVAPDLATQLAMVRAVWNRPMPRLLVFDNCEDEKLLAEWRPVTGGCRVLVTCRRPAFSPHQGVHTLALDVLPRAESLALLRSLDRCQPFAPTDDAALDEICAELGDLPLALHLAGSFLARYRNTVTPATYLAQLRDRALLGHPSLQGRGAESSPTEHDLHVGRTFTLSWQRLLRRGSVFNVARELLRGASWLAPGEPIPRALLVAALAPAAHDTDTALSQEDALHQLLDLGFLDVPEPGTYRIHRLVAAFAQQTYGDVPPSARSGVENALLHEAEQVNDSGFPARLLPWEPHLRAVTDAAREREDEQAASLCHALGRHLHAMGDYPGARPYYEHARAIHERRLGPEHPDTATSLESLALLLQAQGAHVEARSLLERALAIREQQLGPEHLLTGTSLVHLAGLLKEYRYADAPKRALLERALAISEHQLERNYTLQAKSLRHLAFIHRAEGRHSHARLLFERVLAIREQQFGPDHPDTAQSARNLALVLQDQGALAEARPLYERALSICEQQLGPEHPHTAECLNDLAALLQEQGALAEARPLYERALAIRERRLGTDHPQTAMTMNKLATLLHAQRAHAEARPLYERTLVIYEKVLEPGHPYIAMTRGNLAALLHLQEAHTEARPLYERALAMREAALELGRDHFGS